MKKQEMPTEGDMCVTTQLKMSCFRMKGNAKIFCFFCPYIQNFGFFFSLAIGLQQKHEWWMSPLLSVDFENEILLIVR